MRCSVFVACFLAIGCGKAPTSDNGLPPTPTPTPTTTPTPLCEFIEVIDYNRIISVTQTECSTIKDFEMLREVTHAYIVRRRDIGI